MKVLHISFSDSYGGANIAAYRTHKSLEKKIESKMMVYDKKIKAEKNIYKINHENKLIYKLKNYTGVILSFLFKSKYKNSFNLFNSKILQYINNSSSDIVHLHWVNNEILSIIDISKIKKKIVWTFHDMWPFCGSEHYSDSMRYVEGYSNINKDVIGLDLPKYIWKLKRKYFTKKINIICPSFWMLSKVKKSYLFKKNKSYLIRNPINTDLWNYKKKRNSKNIKIFFCGVNFLKDSRKGFFNLVEILNSFSTKYNFTLQFMGEKVVDTKSFQFKTKNLGFVYNEKKIIKSLNYSDVLFLPSESDNLPNVAIEALACGIPVVCTKNNGLSEIIINKFNGLIIDTFNLNTMSYVFDFLSKNKFNGNNISSHTKLLFSYKHISSQLVEVYKKILDDKN